MVGEIAILADPNYFSRQCSHIVIKLKNIIDIQYSMIGIENEACRSHNSGTGTFKIIPLCYGLWRKIVWDGF